MEQGLDIETVQPNQPSNPAGEPALATPEHVAKRHRLWLGRGSRKLITWRPKKLYRCSAKKWLRSVNNSLDWGTSTGGLIFFKYNAEQAQWSDDNWSSWPYILFAQDLGPDSTCGYMAAERKFDLNVDLAAD